MSPDAIPARAVVVIGGASGIGRAVAAACVARGDAVIVADIDARAAEHTASELGALAAVRCDVADPESVAATATDTHAQLGRLDLVMHAAGVMTSGASSLETPLADQRWVIDVNVMGTIHVLTAFVPLLAAQSTASAVVVTGSENSVGVPHLNAAAYTASKHAVLGYADVVRRELPDHVGLSVLCPGIVATDLRRSVERRQAEYGGPATPGDGAPAIMALGMPAAEVAEAVLRGVDAGEFLIMTHDHVRDLAQERYDLIVGAMDRQVPDQGRRYSLDRMVDLIRAQRGG